MRKFQKGGPPVNSEFYPGWLSHWQESLSTVKSSAVVDQIKTMLAMNASFSFYMFHGGTNFGFTSGANTNDTIDSIGYLPQLTSYDYDAPLDEAGDPTEKYFLIKKTLEKAVSILICYKLYNIEQFNLFFFLRTSWLQITFYQLQHIKEPMVNSIYVLWLVYLKKSHNVLSQCLVKFRYHLRPWTLILVL